MHIGLSKCELKAMPHKLVIRGGLHGRPTGRLKINRHLMRAKGRSSTGFSLGRHFRPLTVRMVRGRFVMRAGHAPISQRAAWNGGLTNEPG